ncbi:pseudouridine synthase, partial [Mrakia frigida]|uniref:pseudouridine synthase PUS4 n=1 Tax=Mrakia frigida TaxID=29902 RepID=UPI003FCC206F
MPKDTGIKYPLDGLIGINKPTGQTSMTILEGLKRLGSKSILMAQESVKGGPKARGGIGKIGQGGTLDPLADGVLVVGLGKGTKELGRFLLCSKEYRTVGILGCSTDSYDSDGAIVDTAPWEHLTRQDVENVLDRFRGEILQTPPIYSALKMDGKPLYEYARSNTPLPRPIEARKQIVHELVLESWQEARTEEGGEGHGFRWPEKVLGKEEREVLEKSKKLMDDAEKVPSSTTASTESKPVPSSSSSSSTLPPSTSTTKRVIPPVFTLRMTVSSGTYVRSIVHDIAQALNSAAHVVVLTRTRQGEFSLEKGNCVDWSVFKDAVEEEEKAFK